METLFKSMKFTSVAGKVMAAVCFLALPVFGVIVGPPSTFVTSVQTIFSFPQFPQNPDASLTLGPDGNFYGTSTAGGYSGNGTVYEITTNGVVTLLYSFTGNNDGGDPQDGLTLGKDGNFYGTTMNGGTNGNGTVFQVTTNGVLTTIYTFTAGGINEAGTGTNFDGAWPHAGLTVGLDGDLYGTTQLGGTNGVGTVFKVTTNGVFNALYSFTGGDDGANPAGALALGPDDNFYGTAQGGGTNGSGAVFTITTNGVLTPLYSFSGGNDGASPQSALALGPDGNFYGTASSGGINGSGAIFQITTNGVLTTLYDFTNGTDGANPVAGLTLGPDGNFYGAAGNGGSNIFDGTIFEITTNAVFTALYSFTGGNDGANPAASLTVGPGGNLFGTTQSGGINGDGAVYEMTTNGVFSTVGGFADGDGDNPDGGLAHTSNGIFYGTTQYGGSFLDGTVFGVTSNGVITMSVGFAGTNGRTPKASVTLGLDGKLYGTTYYGGSNNDGAVFEATTNGILTTLYSFTAGPDGGLPRAPLTQGPDGNLYGTTYLDGIFGQGAVFELAPTNGELTPLAGFAETNGAYPEANLTLGRDGNFYGTTYSGGSNDEGAIFEVTTNGALTALYSFRGIGSDGANPMGGLTIGPDGNFYGTTFYGGANGNGTVFQFTTNDVLTILYSFSSEVDDFWTQNLTNSDGAYPLGNLTVGPDGNLYGVTQQGGQGGGGAVFGITTNGVLSPVAYFVGTNGWDPQAGLTLGSDGNFYGTTYSGGVDNLGEVYRLNLQPEFAQQPASEFAAGGGSVTFSAAPFGIGPFSFQWLSNNIPIVGATNGSFTLSNAAAGAVGAYSVAVRNFWGPATSSIASATVFTGPGAVNGAFTLNFVNPTGTTTRIWATTNLLYPNWTPVYTNTTGGAWQFTDNLMCEQRFYLFSTP